MRKIRSIIYTIVSVIIIITSAGCENKWPDNGDLDGMWQLLSMELGGKVVSMKETKHYWSVRSSLIQYTEYGLGDRKYAHFQHKDNMLILTDFCYNWGNTEDNRNNEWIKSEPIEERDILAPWGLYPTQDPQHPERLTQTFCIEHLDYDNMVLSTPTYKLKFRKF